MWKIYQQSHLKVSPTPTIGLGGRQYWNFLLVIIAIKCPWNCWNCMVVIAWAILTHLHLLGHHDQSCVFRNFIGLLFTVNLQLYHCYFWYNLIHNHAKISFNDCFIFNSTITRSHSKMLVTKSSINAYRFYFFVNFCGILYLSLYVICFLFFCN